MSPGRLLPDPLPGRDPPVGGGVGPGAHRRADPGDARPRGGRRPSLGQALDLGCGSGIHAVDLATEDATLLILAFPPGRREPLPRGVGRADIEASYPSWRVSEETEQAGELPWLLGRLDADPRWFRLRRG